MRFKVLFFGKKNDVFSEIFFKILKKNFYKVTALWNYNKNKKTLDKILLKGNVDFIFSFRSHFIFKKEIFSKVRKYAINFHPGPPEYRGVGCVNFAIFNKSKYYGATVHIINKNIDQGKILLVNKFLINPKDTIKKILTKTYFIQIKQLNILINLLKNNKNNLDVLLKKKYSWSKKLYKRKDLEKLYSIKKNISRKKLQLQLKATNFKNFSPYINLYGNKFYYEKKR